MLADSIPAAQFALTETSAHPVSKSSFERKTTPSYSPSTEPYMGPGAALCPLGVNRVGLALGCKLPVCPYEPTFGYTASTEAMGDNRTSRCMRLTFSRADVALLALRG
jgi:hypothetical protein